MVFAKPFLSLKTLPALPAAARAVSFEARKPYDFLAFQSSNNMLFHGICQRTIYI
ncbi:MAG: hypothetical protein ACI9XO_003931 [Paraglaciecola sp.]|jgi:hypothetical protein